MDRTYELPHGCCLTGFGDEISPELDEQLRVLKRLGVGALDLRSAFGKNVLQLTDEEVDQIANRVASSGSRIQTVSSPVNKVRYTQSGADEELAKLRRAAHIAKRLQIRRIRIFSPEMLNAGWDDVRSWMAPQVALAREMDVVLLHENDGRFYGAFPDNARRLLDEYGGPNFRAILDFGNSVLIGLRTMRDWFPWLLPHLDTLHIKDATGPDGRFVAAGEGAGEMVDAFRFLFANGWSGPLTLEPHAQIAGSHGGFSGEQAFEHAVDALLRTIDEARR